ncbi:MAG: YopT-type cysteine protease domain-containing protein [Planctomycetota bacterium]
MDDWLARLCTKTNAEIVEIYNQGDDKRIAGDPLTEEGWCYGMAMHWLIRKFQGKGDFWTWAPSSEAEGKFRMPMAHQRLVKGPVTGSKLGGDADLYHGTAALMRPHGLRQVFASEMISKQSASTMVNEMCCNSATHIMIAFCGNGGHAMAAHFSQLHISFFDPNAGEFAFPRTRMADFTEWLRWFFTGMGYWGTYPSFYLEGFAK